jgi:hypothetical protein
MLVVTRRNIDAKLTFWWRVWTDGSGLRWAWQRLCRVFRHDRTWRVEVYSDVSDDYFVPADDDDDPVRMWVAPDRHRGVVLADEVADRIRSGGFRATDPDVFDAAVDASKSARPSP